MRATAYCAVCRDECKEIEGQRSESFCFFRCGNCGVRFQVHRWDGWPG